MMLLIGTSCPSVAIPRKALGVIRSSVRGDRQALFLSELVLRSCLFQERSKLGYWINFHSDDLIRMMGSRYYELLRELIDGGIIEQNPHYLVDEFSKSYRLTKAARRGGFAQREVRSKTARSIAVRMVELDHDNLRPSGVWFANQFKRLTIDPEIGNDRSIRSSWDHWVVGRWASGHHFARRCAYGRLHWLGTSTSRNVRPYLKGDGCELVAIDVSAAQPLLLYQQARRKYQQRSHQHEHRLITCSANFDDEKLPSDLLQWHELCATGTLYDEVQMVIRSFKGSGRCTVDDVIYSTGYRQRVDVAELAPKKFKRSVLINLFTTIEQMQRSVVFQAIREISPTIAEFVVSMKRSGHEALACSLQRCESNLMIDYVGGRLASEYPGEFAVPIHDALLVVPDFADNASQLIERAFLSHGMRCKVKQEPLVRAA